MRLTFVLFQMSQLRAAKRVCKNPGTKAYYLTKPCNDVARREWLYRDGAARKVLGDRDFVFGDELTRENLLKIAVTADELREVNVYKVCVQPLDGSEFTVHVDVAACRISDLKSQIRAKNGMCPSEQLLYLISSMSKRPGCSVFVLGERDYKVSSSSVGSVGRSGISPGSCGPFAMCGGSCTCP